MMRCSKCCWDYKERQKGELHICSEDNRDTSKRQIKDENPR